MNVKRFIGLLIGDGIVVGAKDVGDAVEFRVLDGGVETTHRIPTKKGSGS